MVEIEITTAKAADAKSIYLLGKKIHELDFSPRYPFHGLSEIKESISVPKENILFTGKLDRQIVGFVYAKILSHHSGGWCLLDNIAVDQCYRHQGIGEKLLKVLYRELKKRNISYVQILEEAHHKKTRGFWKKEGFRETKTFVWAEKEI
jgi:ribosomal protein S18 acetylase RimI-like enzyme